MFFDCRCGSPISQYFCGARVWTGIDDHIIEHYRTKTIDIYVYVYTHIHTHIYTIYKTTSKSIMHLDRIEVRQISCIRMYSSNVWSWFSQPIESDIVCPIWGPLRRREIYRVTQMCLRLLKQNRSLFDGSFSIGEKKGSQSIAYLKCCKRPAGST
jgi:hypothetical protein